MSNEERLAHAILHLSYMVATEDPNSGKKGVYELALTALEEKLARENPEPLTLEQLVKAAEDMPIWVHEIEKRWRDGWCIWDGSAAIVPNCRPCWHSYTDYGKTWITYAHKPRTEDDHA